jgi:hypothetical protein
MDLEFRGVGVLAREDSNESLHGKQKNVFVNVIYGK